MDEAQNSLGQPGDTVPVESVEVDFKTAMSEAVKNDPQKELVRIVERELLDKLKNELELTRTNTLNVINEWRDKLREVKAEEIKEDIVATAQASGRSLSVQDSTIRALTESINEANTHFDNLHQSQMDAIDHILKIQEARLALLQQEYERDLSILSKEFEEERNRLETSHKSSKLQLEHTISITTEQNAAQAQAQQTEFEHAREALKRKALENVHILQTDTDLMIEALERRFEDAHVEYLSATDTRTRDFKILSERGQADAASNSRQQRALVRLTRLKENTQAKLAILIRDADSRDSQLEAEKEKLLGFLNVLKRRLARAHQRQTERLSACSTVASSIQAVLQDQLTVGQRIILLAQRVAALEAEQGGLVEVLQLGARQTEGYEEEIENVNLGANGLVVRYDHAAGRAHVAEPSLAYHGRDVLKVDDVDGLFSDNNNAQREDDIRNVPGVVEGEEEAEALTGFFKRYNNLLLNTLALENIRETLRVENQQLEEVAKQVMDGLTVNSEIMDNPNSLLVVNGRTNVNMEEMVRVLPKPTTQKIVTIEAAEVTRNLQKQRR